MKKLIILFLGMFLSVYTFAQWEWQIPKPTGAALSDAGSFATDIVFAVGLNGTIIKTTDGGSSFVQIESGTKQFLKTIYCINENVGWVSSDSGLVLRTENGGSDWVKVSNSKAWEKSSFFALDEGRAWLSTDYGKLLKTTDGGQNWENIETGIGKSFSLITFIDATTGFSVINESTPEHESITDTVVLKTQDGGQHWDTLDLTFHENINFIKTFQDDHIWIGTYGYLLKSDDRGQTWDTVWLPGNRSDEEAVSVAFRSPDSVWLLYRQPGDWMMYYYIDYTVDGGLTWQKKYESISSWWGNSCNNSINELFYTSGTCWAVGGPGTVLSYGIGDTAWQKHYKTAGGSLRDLYFLDGQNGYAVGDINTLLKTQDGGKNWEIADDLPGDYGFRVYFTSKERGFVSIVNEGLFRTNDGGKTWKNVLEKDGFLVSILFDGTEEGWVLHSHGEMYHTTDEGETWQLLSTLPLSTWWDACFTSQNTGFVSGKEGIMKSSDGGFTWQQVFNPGIFINDIDFIDFQTGWAVGDEGLICKTTDGGDTWKIMDTLTNTSLYDISFINHQTGYLVSDGYGVFRTDDGGENWEFEPVLGLPMILMAGNWDVLLTHNNDIWTLYNCQILHKTDQTTGIEQGLVTAHNEITLFPNPSSGRLIIETGTDLQEIMITNINGQVLFSAKIEKTKRTEQDISFLKPGIYFVRALTEKGIATGKFVKME